MPKPFALISSSDIQEQEFFEVLRTAGGVIEDASALAGRISRGEQHVWVSLDHSLLKDYEADEITGWASRRLDMTPGITGLWQVLGRNDIPFEEMTKLDYLYVTNWSLWWDLKILAQTIPVVLGRRGAY